MKNSLSIVRDAVIRAVPEIVELKFGCQIEKDGEIYSLAVETDYGIFEKTLEGYWMCVSQSGQAVSLSKGVRTNVLGRPIRLGDVLVAIDDKVNSWDFVCHANGVMTFHRTEAKWNIRNDSLEAQSPETISFLADLLDHEK